MPFCTGQKKTACDTLGVVQMQNFLSEWKNHIFVGLSRLHVIKPRMSLAFCTARAHSGFMLDLFTSTSMFQGFFL